MFIICISFIYSFVFDVCPNLHSIKLKRKLPLRSQGTWLPLLPSHSFFAESARSLSLSHYLSRKKVIIYDNLTSWFILKCHWVTSVELTLSPPLQRILLILFLGVLLLKVVFIVPLNYLFLSLQVDATKFLKQRNDQPMNWSGTKTIV